MTEISVVRRPVEWLKAHPFAADVALTVLILAICAPMFLTIDLEDYPSQRDPDAIGGVLLVATIVPLAWRRVAPRLVLLATLVAAVPFLILDYPDVGSTTASLIAMYTVAAHCERRDEDTTVCECRDDGTEQDECDAREQMLSSSLVLHFVGVLGVTSQHSTSRQSAASVSSLPSLPPPAAPGA